MALRVLGPASLTAASPWALGLLLRDEDSPHWKTPSGTGANTLTSSASEMAFSTVQADQLPTHRIPKAFQDQFEKSANGRDMQVDPGRSALGSFTLSPPISGESHTFFSGKPPAFRGSHLLHLRLSPIKPRRPSRGILLLPASLAGVAARVDGPAQAVGDLHLQRAPGDAGISVFNLGSLGVLFFSLFSRGTKVKPLWGSRLFLGLSNLGALGGGLFGGKTEVKTALG